MKEVGHKRLEVYEILGKPNLITNAEDTGEKRELSYTIGRNGKIDVAILENSMKVT